MIPHYETEHATLWLGDCIEVMRQMPDASVDSIVTDPPYGLGFMGKDWDDLPPGLDFAVEALRVLKPGGHLLAFGGTRTWHRLAVAVEDAGFEIRDSIAWLYGSGFPKSLDVAQAIDKSDAGVERLARAREFQAWLREHITPQRVNELTGTDMGHHLTTHPTQPSIATAALFDLQRAGLLVVPARIEELVAQRTVESENYAQWEVVGEHRRGISRGNAGVTSTGDGKTRTASFTDEAREWEGWGTALKPAFEPIVVARKPLIGTVAANVIAYGTGALNIDATRTAGETVRTTRNTALGVMNDDGWTPTAGVYETPSGGRWPTNVLLDESQAAALDKQTGTLTSGRIEPHHKAAGKSQLGTFNIRDRQGEQHPTYGDSGGASRFFPTFRYEAKAPTRERPTSIDEQGNAIAHPTVKPVDLMRWLCRLVTPPGGTILEPFAGSGTTVEAALTEGFHIIAIEREAGYMPLIEARMVRPMNGGLFSEDEL